MTSGLLRPCQGISVLRDRGVVQTSMSGRHAVISWVMSDRSRQPQTDRLHYHLDRWKVDAPRTSLHRSVTVGLKLVKGLRDLPLVETNTSAEIIDFHVISF
ncbi:hypothetical protein F2P81_024619 [Scophthalmus maximus]|uniref:Uncharacterized protein n=1 Tax=Scophthalmus maximus TaxID=52904 RepID=A0A6A4RUN4_SCOMX|nr:hypothetical protein F2P81_024619 [Scophthalmus maximus]